MSFKIKLNQPSVNSPDMTDKVTKLVDELLPVKVATEPIPVIKKLARQKDGSIGGYHMSKFTYEVGKTYTEPLFLEEKETIIQRVLEPRKGFGFGGFGMYPHPMYLLEIHSMLENNFRSEDDKLRDRVAREINGSELCKGFHSWKQKPNEALRKGEILANFVIPKGARYLTDESEYISDSIIFESIISEAV